MAKYARKTRNEHPNTEYPRAVLPSWDRIWDEVERLYHDDMFRAYSVWADIDREEGADTPHDEAQ